MEKSIWASMEFVGSSLNFHVKCIPGLSQINPRSPWNTAKGLIAIENGIQSRNEGTIGSSDYFHIFLPVVGFRLLFIFLGYLTWNHVIGNINFSQKLNSMIPSYWKNISPTNRAATLSYRTLHFHCFSKVSWFVSAPVEVWWHQKKNPSVLFFLFLKAWLQLPSACLDSISL